MARILIIDDDAEVRELAALALTRCGHVVVEAGDGDEGLAKCHQQPFDLVITDMVMPTRDGLEVLLAMRNEFPNTPVVAMSGLSSRSARYLQVADELGAVETLSKPFRLADLVSVVSRALAHSETPGT